MKRPEDRAEIKRILLIITFGVVLFCALWNLKPIAAALGWILGLLMPFIFGLCIAFILNVPMRAIERALFKPVPEIKGGKNGKKPAAGFGMKLRAVLYRAKRPLSIILSLLAIIAVVALVVLLIIPQIKQTALTVKASLPGFEARLNSTLQPIYDRLPEFQEWVTGLEVDWSSLVQKIGGYLEKGADGIKGVLGSTVGFATSLFSGIFNFVLGLIFAVYILAQKEKLASQVKRILLAFMPEKFNNTVFHIASMANDTFSRFLSGQCTEAVIIGTLCCIGMVIFRFPYAAAIGVLVGFTALIPIVGAFIGTAVGAILIFVTDPIKAFWFIVFILVLQQIEGNFIYPKVVGNSVGLPSMWVLFAVTVGGSVGGILGMLVSVPACSVIYCLIREEVNRRLAEKQSASSGF